MPKHPLAANATPTPEDHPPTLLNAQDAIGDALNFVEATFMAASDLDDMTQVGAIHALAMVTRERLEEAIAMLKAIRAEEERRG